LSAPCLAAGGLLLLLGLDLDDVAAVGVGGSKFVDLVLEGNHAARNARHPLAIHGDEGFGRPNDGSVAQLFGRGGALAKFVLDVLERHAGELDGDVAARHCRDFGLLRFHEGLGGVLHEFGELVAVERHDSVLSVRRRVHSLHAYLFCAESLVSELNNRNRLKFGLVLKFSSSD